MVKATLKFLYGCDHNKALKTINHLSSENVGVHFVKSKYNGLYYTLIFKAPCRIVVYTIIESLVSEDELLGTIKHIKIRGRDEKDYSKYLR